MRKLAPVFISLLLFGCADEASERRDPARADGSSEIEDSELDDTQDDTEELVKEEAVFESEQLDEQSVADSMDTLVDTQDALADQSSSEGTSGLTDSLKNTDTASPNKLEDAYLKDDNKVLLYQLYSPTSNDHMLSLNKDEGSHLGYSHENKIQFELLKKPVPGYEQALYRCNINGKHFASLIADCEGQKVESMLGYLLPPDSMKGSPLARCYASGQHFMFFEESDCVAPHINEGVFGKVLKVKP